MGNSASELSSWMEGCIAEVRMFKVVNCNADLFGIGASEGRLVVWRWHRFKQQRCYLDTLWEGAVQFIHLWKRAERHLYLVGCIGDIFKVIGPQFEGTVDSR